MLYVWAYEQGSKSKRAMGVRASSSATAAAASASAVDDPDTPRQSTSEPPTNDPPSDTQPKSPLEQSGNSKNAILDVTSTSPPADEEKIQDVLVPWVLQSHVPKKPKSGVALTVPKGRAKDPSLRIESEADTLDGSLSRSTSDTPTGTTTGNGMGMGTGTGTMASTSTSPSASPTASGTTTTTMTTISAVNAADAVPEPTVYHRYYHLFIAGELEKLVRDAAEVEGYDVYSASTGSDGGPLSSTSTGSAHSADGADGVQIDAQPQGRGRGQGQGQGQGQGETRRHDKWLRIVDQGWEMDNWWLIGQVGRYE